jgi:threonylcarbamoyladenosine tRNA methylthiotransferase MtaB
MPTFSIQTLGCKVNQYESEQMATLLRKHGYTESDSPSADVQIINTCSVTTSAASQSRQEVRRAVRLPVTGGNAHAKVVVTGCWATSDKSAAEVIPGVGLVLTHQDDVASQIRNFLHLTEASSNPGRGAMSLPLLDSRQNHNQRAFLKIQDGCDAHCTYCIIPKLRPLPWSKPIDELVLEARRLVDSGHVEIILTGIFLGAYGQETALRRRQSTSDQSLAAAIESLCAQVPGLRRIRLSSLEPGDLNDELLSVLRSHEQVVPHFHLPLQSGSDEILRRMHRQYRRDDFKILVDRLREAFDRPALTTDIIVGFPGETDHEFEQTVAMATHSGFIHIHAFPYSPRPARRRRGGRKSSSTVRLSISVSAT